jgi:hypothetical protein
MRERMALFWSKVLNEVSVEQNGTVVPNPLG